MRDYYEFIFTVAENTDKMAKVVYDYIGKWEKEMEIIDKATGKGVWGQLGKHHSLIERCIRVERDKDKVDKAKGRLKKLFMQNWVFTWFSL